MSKSLNPLFTGQKKAVVDGTATPVMSVSDDNPWKVLVIDDEPEVHAVTKLVLRDFEWDGRRLLLLSAHSAAEAKAVLAQEKEVAVCLVDVVMETTSAGLDLVRYIRDDLKNTQVRLILRTGQPGQAPEKQVIRNYDINDYKDKTELTDVKLHTLMCATLRSYRDIMRLEQNRVGLEMVIESSARIFEARSLQKFTKAVLMQLMSLLNVSRDAIYLKVLAGFSATEQSSEFHILAGIGEFGSLVGSHDRNVLSADVQALLDQAINGRRNVFVPGHLVLYSETDIGSRHLLYLRHPHQISDLDRRLIELYCTNVSIAYENQILRDEVDETQREIVYTLSEAIENRSQETGNHIRRVAEYVYLFARELGFTEEEAARMRAAAPLHDLGKVAIPDSILHKPGKLDAAEWEVMKRHVDIGYQLLSHSKRTILQYASEIAYQHHEKWDGSGYPRGLAGSDIHILGRIVALVDVFDAMTSRRCYKDPWTIEQAVEAIKEQSGKHFDPALVELFLKHLPRLVEIRQTYDDLPSEEV